MTSILPDYPVEYLSKKGTKPHYLRKFNEKRRAAVRAQYMSTTTIGAPQQTGTKAHIRIRDRERAQLRATTR